MLLEPKRRERADLAGNAVGWARVRGTARPVTNGRRVTYMHGVEDWTVLLMRPMEGRNP